METSREHQRGNDANTRRAFVKTGILAGSMALLPGNVWGQGPARSGAERNRLPAGVNPTDPLLKIGCLDVTRVPYSADPSGKSDCTAALQKASDDARDHGLVCYFPEGTYLISDTISCEQQAEKLDEPRHVDGGTQHYWPKRTPMFFIGSTKGKRPVLKLSKDAKGFDNPQKPKFAFYIWTQTWFDAPGKEEPVWGVEQPNINFNHIFKGIDLDIRGHAGAVGIRFSGAQGATLQDSTIQADGALAGMSDCPGQGGGTYNIQVIGGRHGILIDSGSRFPILTDCEFTGQTDSAIRYTGKSIQVPTLLVGCRIESGGVAAVDMTEGASFGGISAIDSMITLPKVGVFAKTLKSENIFLENVYIRGADAVYTGGAVIPASSQWTLIQRYSSHDDRSVNLINGIESTGEVAQWSAASQIPDFNALRDKHYSGTPSFEDSDAVNVSSFGALGDGVADDTEAFRKAITASDKVFVPKGNFKLSGSLQLNTNTRLFGFSRTLAAIGEADTGRGRRGESQRTVPSEAGAFTLNTAPDVQASPGFFFLSVRGRVVWNSGRGDWMLTSGRPVFSATGGGRIYALGAMGQPLIFEGIQQPAAFYTLNVERVHENPQSEFRNCRHVRIYYLKVEAGTIQVANPPDKHTPCRITDSQDIRIFCNYGNVRDLGDKPMVEVVNSTNVVVAQLKAFFPSTFPHIRETQGNQEFELPSTKICALFVRD